MKTSQFYSNTSSKGLLIGLIAVHILGTIIAYTIYVNLASGLGDGYAPVDFRGFNIGSGAYNPDLGLTRTILVHGIYAHLGTILPSPGHGAGFLAPMTLGLVVAIVTWHAFRNVYTQINPIFFWTCNLLPHFLVWSGASSKEQIVIIFGIIVIDFAAKRSFAARRLTIINLILVFISLWFIFIIRGNYFVIYFTIFATSLLAPSLHKIKINRLSVGVWALTFILVIMGLTFAAFLDPKFFSEDVVAAMKHVEASFLGYEGGSNRTNIQWNDISDFMYNSLWGIPQGFIGPTLLEAISKPIQFPVFLEGLVFLYIFCYLFVRLFQLANASNMLRVHIVPYLFIALAVVFVSYSYLIFNAGSALRLKQSLHPILIFYPLLILAYARANNLMKTNTKKMPDEC